MEQKQKKKKTAMFQVGAGVPRRVEGDELPNLDEYLKNEVNVDTEQHRIKVFKDGKAVPPTDLNKPMEEGSSYSLATAPKAG